MIEKAENVGHKSVNQIGRSHASRQSHQPKSPKLEVSSMSSKSLKKPTNR